MSIPELSYEQKTAIATADHLLSIFGRLGFMGSHDINDVIVLMRASAPVGHSLETEAYDSLLDMLHCMRAFASIGEDDPIVVDRGAGAT